MNTKNIRNNVIRTADKVAATGLLVGTGVLTVPINLCWSAVDAVKDQVEIFEALGVGIKKVWTKELTEESETN